MRYLLALAVFLGCVSCGRQTAMSTTGTATTGPTYLALGDSYTIGESVGEGDRYPNQLAGRMGWRAPEIVARTGWTGKELLAAMDGAQFREGGYDHVTLLIGVNNQYRGYAVEEFRGEFKALLGRAIGLARGDAGHVVVISIPDWGETPFGQGSGRAGISGEIDAFNAVCREESRAREVRFVDITPISRTVRGDATLTADDGLHPSGKQYGLWVGEIVKSLGGRK
jgi:lysophospholipase L1-like esterase